VAEVQHPELGPLDFLLLGEAAERGVEAASPELRLAERTEVQRRRVCLQDAGDLETHLDRVGERVGRDEVQVVSRAVVLPELPPRRPHETTYGKVESRRAVLTLVVAGGGEWPRASRWGAVLEDVARGAIDERVAAPAPFVRRRSRVAQARQDEAGMQVV